MRKPDRITIRVDNIDYVAEEAERGCDGCAFKGECITRSLCGGVETAFGIKHVIFKEQGKI